MCGLEWIEVAIAEVELRIRRGREMMPMMAVRSSALFS